MPTKRKRDRTREALLERLRQLKLARDAFWYSYLNLSGGEYKIKAEGFINGFDWAVKRIREIA